MNKLAQLKQFKYASRGLIAIAMTGVVLTLPGCGGGGNEGSPLNPSPGPATPSPLAINPQSVTAYANQPVAFLVTGGVPPYRAFSSNSSVVSVLQDVVGSTITISPANVSADTSVTITVTDQANNTVGVTALVRPSTVKLDDLKIEPATATPGVGCAPAVCSGQTATATLTLRSVLGEPIANRQVRFDALQGQYNFVLDDAGTQLTKSITVTSDSTGRAIVRLKADVNASTAFALLRATDVVNGSRVDQSFPIAQFTDGQNTLTVSPSKWSISGPFKGLCSSGIESGFYVFGGTPPYRVVSSSPDAVLLANVFGVGRYETTTTVATNGGYFVGRTTGVCVTNTNSIVFVTDATGRTVGVGLENKEGTDPAPTPPPPAALVVSPGVQPLPSIELKPAVGSTPAVRGCAGSGAVAFAVAGGRPPYRVAFGAGFPITVTVGTQPIAQAATNIFDIAQTAAFNAAFSRAEPFAIGDVATLEIVDADLKKVSAKIVCN